MSNPFAQMAAELTAERGPERVDLQEYMAALVAQHGSGCKAADACKIQRSEFWRVMCGKRPPSDRVLELLGLRRVVYYVKL